MCTSLDLWFFYKRKETKQHWLFTLPHEMKKKLLDKVLFSRGEAFCERVDGEAAMTVHIDGRIVAVVEI